MGSAGARVCPNLPQRRSGPGSAVRRGAEYQRFFSRASARSGSLWQIWTNRGRRGPGGEGGRPPRRGPRRRRRRGHRRGGRSRTGRTPRSTAPAPPARRRPDPRERGLTIENEGLTPVLMGQPPCSWVNPRRERAEAAGPRDYHDRPRTQGVGTGAAGGRVLRSVRRPPARHPPRAVLPRTRRFLVERVPPACAFD